jgi:SNF2 family DNA or RNA helicase
MDLKKINAAYRKVSYYKKHGNLSLDEWQFALRKKYAEINPMGIEKTGPGKVFTEYIVRNPDRKSAYSVSIRSGDNSRNFCTCYDFKTNRLGTCKHIEAVLHLIRSKTDLSVILEQEYEPGYSSIYLDYRGERKIRIRIGTENHAAFEKLRDKYFSDENILPPENYSKFNKIRQEAMEISPSFRCYPDALDFILEIRDKNSRAEHINEIYKPDGKPVFQDLLNAELFPYQEEGIRFAGRAGRCLLADDMGLGKTIQAIGTAELLKRDYGITKVLIICPTSLKYQWKNEIQKFAGSSVRVIEGLPHVREKQYRGEEFYKIVSYQTASNDFKEISATFPDLVILDEAQRIKNFLTKTSRNIKRIPSTYALVLTGTPLENKLEELYSVVQFLDPFVLGPFHEFLARHQLTSDTGKITGYRDLNLIGERLSDLMLRRKKSDVLMELPERMDKLLLVPMTEKQLVLHDEFKTVVARLVLKWRRLGFLPEKDRQRLMINLNLMRMVCDSTYVLDQETRHDTKIDELMNILEEIFNEGDEKVVVFSQWERMTRIVSGELNARGIGYEYLHGGVPAVKREALFTNFNTDPDKRVFLSTDAGGTGLNLQTASYMVNLDIPWNPAVLEQRIGRIHRMGQKNKVSIINMVSAGTIEHRMTEILKFKSSLAEGILDRGDDVIFLGESKFNKLMGTVKQMLPDEAAEEKPAVDVGKEISSEKRDFDGPSEPDLKAAEIGPEPLTLFDNLEEEPAGLLADSLAGPVSAAAGQDRIETDHLTGPAAEPTAGYDDIAETERIAVPGNEQASAKTDQLSDPETILKNGMNFITGLARTFRDPEATKRLVSEVVAKDEKDGKTYLKIPVESEKTVEDFIGMIGSLIKGMG